VEHLLRDRAEQEARQAAAAVRAEDEQVDVAIADKVAGDFGDFALLDAATMPSRRWSRLRRSMS
jgi:hypothetical protein